jgi:hypothetical protein
MAGEMKPKPPVAVRLPLESSKRVNIADFASGHHLKLKTDKSDGTPVVVGRAGSLYEFSAEHRQAPASGPHRA